MAHGFPKGNIAVFKYSEIVISLPYNLFEAHNSTSEPGCYPCICVMSSFLTACLSTITSGFQWWGKWKYLQSSDLHFRFLKRNSKPSNSKWLALMSLFGKTQITESELLCQYFFFLTLIWNNLIQEVEHMFMFNLSKSLTPKIQCLVLICNQHWYPL